MPSPVYCASVHKTSILYKCLQNQFTVQQYTKPVYCTSVPKPVYGTSVYKTSSLCKCTQNQFTVQVYTILVYWLIMKGMYRDRTLQRLRNVQGRNITILCSPDPCKTSLLYKCTITSLWYMCTQNQFTVEVYTKSVYCMSMSIPFIINQ